MSFSVDDIQTYAREIFKELEDSCAKTLWAEIFLVRISSLRLSIGLKFLDGNRALQMILQINENHVSVEFVKFERTEHNKFGEDMEHSSKGTAFSR